MPSVILGRKVDVHYLEAEAILAHATIHLVSLEGTVFIMDKTVLAASSHLLKGLLLEQDCQESVFVCTEVPKSHLALVCQFVTTGTIPGIVFVHPILCDTEPLASCQTFLPNSIFFLPKSCENQVKLTLTLH